MAMVVAMAWPLRWSSQCSQASMPSPVVADSCSTAMDGFTRRAIAMQRSTSKRRCGSRSVLLSSMSSAAANMSEYLSGLSSPSVTDSTTILAASPRSHSAGQTRLPTFSMNSSSPPWW